MTHQNPAPPSPTARRRNSDDSRQSLLAAAGELFSERGFDRTTTRDIGERAGLDPTLITRYFGNKAGLYVATLRTDFAAEEPGALRDLLHPGRMTALLDRVGRRGTGPIYDAALRRHTDPAVDTEARAVLTERLVDPMEHHLSDAGSPDARLLAEIIAAAFVGVAAGRTSGAFPALAQTPSADVEELLAQALRNLVPQSTGLDPRTK